MFLPGTAEPAAMRNWRMMAKHLASSDRDCSRQSQSGSRAGRKRVFPCWSTRVTFRVFHVEQSLRKSGGTPPPRTDSGGNQRCSTWNNPELHVLIIVPRETTCIPRWSLLDFAREVMFGEDHCSR